MREWVYREHFSCLALGGVALPKKNLKKGATAGPSGQAGSGVVSEQLEVSVALDVSLWKDEPLQLCGHHEEMGGRFLERTNVFPTERTFPEDVSGAPSPLSIDPNRVLVCPSICPHHQLSAFSLLKAESKRKEKR